MAIGLVQTLDASDHGTPPALTEDLNLLKEGGGSIPAGEHHPFTVSVAS